MLAFGGLCIQDELGLEMNHHHLSSGLIILALTTPTATHPILKMRVERVE